jgi:hypothetical protein
MSYLPCIALIVSKLKSMKLFSEQAFPHGIVSILCCYYVILGEVLIRLKALHDRTCLYLCKVSLKSLRRGLNFLKGTFFLKSLIQIYHVLFRVKAGTFCIF